ncbi:ANTAR domain-containing response regulator [Sporosarcina sp. CAU 1771]
MKKRILIVEDESIIRMDLSSIFTANGYEVVGEAGDGEKAIELAFELQPDLIVMDIKMPKLDGLKASKIISGKLDVPIILLTAYSQKEFIEQAKHANVVAYLVKPVSEVNLIPAVEVAFHQAEKIQEIRDSVSAAKNELEQRKLVEKAKGLLMEKEGLSEDEAYQKIRRTSMNKHQSMLKTSQIIISESEK